MCNDEHAHHAQHAMGRLGRRGLLATGAAATLTLGSVSFANAAPSSGEQTKVVRGTLPPGSPDFVYLPVEVPRGVREIHVSYAYERPVVPPGTQGNTLDIGIFGERGTELGGDGFRGWSGGARTEFFVRADDATPGYIPGPVRAGTWNIALGPYTVAPQGLAYEVTVTLRFGAPGKTPEPVYPPERAKGRGRAWYRGDCHLHSWYSDGRRTPAEIAALARAAGLDFINASEHNTHAAHAHCADQAGDDLLILTGEEVTTRNGHVVALGTDPGTFVDWRYRPATTVSAATPARSGGRAASSSRPTRTPPASAATGSSASARRTLWRCGTARTPPTTRSPCSPGTTPLSRPYAPESAGPRRWATVTHTATPIPSAPRKPWSSPTT